MRKAMGMDTPSSKDDVVAGMARARELARAAMEAAKADGAGCAASPHEVVVEQRVIYRIMIDPKGSGATT